MRYEAGRPRLVCLGVAVSTPHVLVTRAGEVAWRMEVSGGVEEGLRGRRREGMLGV